MASNSLCEMCLQLQEHVKDSRVSEIIDVYEQKLAAFAVSKESTSATLKRDECDENSAKVVI